MQEMLKDKLDFFACPACGGKIALENDFLNCLNCEKKYPIIDKIPVFIESERNIEQEKQ